MNQYKFVRLKTCLNYVPEILLEEMGQGRALDAAYLALRDFMPKKLLSKFMIAVSEIQNHKAKLPSGIHKVREVYYTPTRPSAVDDVDVDHPEIFMTSVLDEDSVDNANRTEFLRETTISLAEHVSNYGTPLTYYGQDAFVVNNDYINYYDGACDSGFTVDRQYTCITTDEKSGYIIFTYWGNIEDDDKNFLIPDDPSLIQGLAKFIEAKAYGERVARREVNTERLYQTRMMEATNLLTHARGQSLLRSFDWKKYSQLIFGNSLFRHPYLTGMNKNYMHH